MSTYNADTDYELIDYFGLFDLVNARVIQAQINSINGETNSASITLSGECAALAAVGTSEVKFFYHCENSTGTLEDLANGHQAFKAGDFVYCLHMPYVSDGIPERFFIIGHVDKKGTQRCRNNDILLIAMFANPLADPQYLYPSSIWPMNATETWITLFDCNTGSTIDPSSFAPLDTESPPPPDSFPCLGSEAVSAWIAYNFIDSIPTHSCPLTISNTDITGGPSVPTIQDEDGCDRLLQYQFVNGVIVDSENFVGGDIELGKYYSAEVSRSLHQYDLPLTGWALYDSVTGEDANIVLSHDQTLQGVITAGAGELWSGTVSTNVQWTVSNGVTGDASTTVVDNGTFVWGDLSAKIHWLGDQMGPGYMHDGSDGVTATGSSGFYLLCTLIDTSWVVNGWPTYQAAYDGRGFSATRVDAFCDAVASNPLSDAFNFDYYTPVVDNPLVGTNIFIPGICFGSVTIFDDIDGELEYSLSPFRCMRSRDAALSRGLEAAYVDLKRAVFQRTVVKRFGYNDSFGAWSWLRPYSFEALKKKTITDGE